MNATTRTIHDGKLYITAQHRGTEYCLMRLGDAWFVGSKRLGLGRYNIGGGKHYETLADVAAGCKAFGGIENLNRLVYGITDTAAA